MKTFFSWGSKDDPFDSTRHEACSIPIFSFYITQREGEAALAKIVTQPDVIVPLGEPIAFLGVKSENKATLLFKGRPMGLAALSAQGLLEISLVASPDDSLPQIESLCQSLKEEALWDPLFVDPGRGQEALDVLEARSELFYWDRLMGKLSLSNLFRGRHQIALTEKEIFKDSLQFYVSHKPLEAIDVILRCEWTQRLAGELDVGAAIAKQCTSGVLGTLTPGDLKNRWPQVNSRLGRSGYRVVESHLQSFHPPSLGGLNLYPTITPKLAIWDETHQSPLEIRLQRHWFRPKLVVEWHYQQKRQETVRLRLHHKTPWRPTGSVRTLALTLQHVGDSADSSFFLTDRGQQALEQAIEMARAHLAYAARCLLVEVKVPFEIGMDLTLDHTLTIRNDQLPEQEMTGKVTAYRLINQDEGSYAWIQMAVALPVHIPPFLENPHASYGSQDYGELGAKAIYRTPSGIPYLRYHEQIPQNGLNGNLERFEEALIEDIQIHGEAQAQWIHLCEQSYPKSLTTLASLEHLPTTVYVRFKDLRTRDREEHVIDVVLPEPWGFSLT